MRNVRGCHFRARATKAASTAVVLTVVLDRAALVVAHSQRDTALDSAALPGSTAIFSRDGVVRGTWVVGGAGRGTGVVGGAGRSTGVVGRARYRAPADRVDHIQGDRLRIGLGGAPEAAPDSYRSSPSSKDDEEDHRDAGEVDVDVVGGGGGGGHGGRGAERREGGEMVVGGKRERRASSRPLSKPNTGIRAPPNLACHEQTIQIRGYCALTFGSEI